MVKKAFTLIELLIVVAIIAILAAIAVPNFLEAQTRAKVSRTVAEARTIGIALESYNVDNREYPPDVTAGHYPTCALRAGDTYYAGLALTSPIAYMNSIPIDIFNATPIDTTGLAQPDPRLGQFYMVKKYSTPATGEIRGSNPWATDGKPFEFKTRNAVWMLWNIGPSHNYGKNSIGDACWEIPYDPTNGTVSNGGIWRLSTGALF